jgi:hypothetical protein
MNRALLFGIAIFFAVVGIALMGSDSKVLAGHGCNGGCAGAGCDGGCMGACHGGGCAGNACNGGCNGRRHHRRNRCHGCHANACCGNGGGCAGGGCAGGCAGSAAPATDVAPAPAPEKTSGLDRARAGKVSFRR